MNSAHVNVNPTTADQLFGYRLRIACWPVPLVAVVLLSNLVIDITPYTQVVKLEQPELEERHHDLVNSIASDHKQLLYIEDQILGHLNHAGSGVGILDDEVPTSPADSNISVCDIMSWLRS